MDTRDGLTRSDTVGLTANQSDRARWWSDRTVYRYGPSVRPPTAAPPEGSAPRQITELSDRCPRCRSADFQDFHIHDGRSIRRDCRRCKRFIGFVSWYGQHAVEGQP